MEVAHHTAAAPFLFSDIFSQTKTSSL